MAGPTRSATAEYIGASGVSVVRPGDQEVTAAFGDLNLSDPSAANPFVKPGESFDDIYATESGAPPGYSLEWQPMQPTKPGPSASSRVEMSSPGTSPSLTNSSTGSSSSRLENFSSTSVDKGKGKVAEGSAGIFAWAVKNDPFQDSDSDDGVVPAAAAKGKGKGKAVDPEWDIIQSTFGDDSDDDIPPPQDRECMVCTVAQPPLSFPARPPTKQCQHKADICYGCISMYVEAEVTSKGAGAIGAIKCPGSECEETMQFEDVARAADKEVFERYETLLLRQELGKEGDFVWCKNPKCGHGQLHAEGEQNPIVICHSCKAKSCWQHDCLWHEGITCTQYDRQLNGEEEPPEEPEAPPPVPGIFIPVARPGMPGGWDNDIGGGGWNVTPGPPDAHIPSGPAGAATRQEPPRQPSSSSTPSFLRNVLRPFSGSSRKPAADSSRGPAPVPGFSSGPGPSAGGGRDGLTDEDLAIFAQFSEDPPVLPTRPSAPSGGSFGAPGGWNPAPAAYQNQAPFGGSAPQTVPSWFRQQPQQQQPFGWGQPQQQWVDPNASFDDDRALAQRLAAEEQQYERDRQMAFEMEREIRQDEERRIRRDEERMREQERRRMEQERARQQQERIRLEQERAREWRRQEEEREELRRRQHMESERQRLAQAQASRSNESALEARRRQKAENEASERWMTSVTRECPKCSKPIEKNGGCDHMKCTRCGKDFSWAKARPSRPK